MGICWAQIQGEPDLIVILRTKRCILLQNMVQSSLHPMLTAAQGIAIAVQEPIHVGTLHHLYQNGCQLSFQSQKALERKHKIYQFSFQSTSSRPRLSQRSNGNWLGEERYRSRGLPPLIILSSFSVVQNGSDTSRNFSESAHKHPDIFQLVLQTLRFST